LKEYLAEALASQGQLKVGYRVVGAPVSQFGTVVAIDALGLVFAGGGENQFGCMPWTSVSMIWVKK
jgi:hypothetical protein